MKSSCIKHPAAEPMIIIRQWQLEFCDGNVVAAALLSLFEYWHNIKLDIADKNKTANEKAMQEGEELGWDESLFQWHTQHELIESLVGICTSRNTLAKAIKLLTQKGAITLHRNPRFKWDNTTHYLFHPEVCQQFLDKRETEKQAQNTPPNTHQCSNLIQPSDENRANIGSESSEYAPKNERTIPESTTEITTKIPTAHVQNQNLNTAKDDDDANSTKRSGRGSEGTGNDDDDWVVDESELLKDLKLRMRGRYRYPHNKREKRGWGIVFTVLQERRQVYLDFLYWCAERTRNGFGEFLKMALDDNLFEEFRATPPPEPDYSPPNVVSVNTKNTKAEMLDCLFDGTFV